MENDTILTKNVNREQTDNSNEINIFHFVDAFIINYRILLIIFFVTLGLSYYYQINNKQIIKIPVSTITFNKDLYQSLEEKPLKIINPKNFFFKDDFENIKPIQVKDLKNFHSQKKIIPYSLTRVSLAPELSIKSFAKKLQSENNFLQFLKSNTIYEGEYAIFQQLSILENNLIFNEETPSKIENSTTIFIDSIGMNDYVRYKEFLMSYVNFTKNLFEKEFKKKMYSSVSKISQNNNYHLSSINEYISVNSKITLDEFNSFLTSLQLQVKLCEKFIQNCIINESELFFSDHDLVNKISQNDEFNIKWLNENYKFYNELNSIKAVNNLYSQKFSAIVEYINKQEKQLKIAREKIEELNIANLFEINDYASTYYTKLFYQYYGSANNFFKYLTFSTVISICFTLFFLIGIVVRKSYLEYQGVK